MTNALSDLKAIIHSPQTQQMAEVFDRHYHRGPRRSSHAFGTAVLLASRWALHSGEQAAGTISELGELRFVQEAARAGVHLTSVPTIDHLDLALAEGGSDLVAELGEVLVSTSVELAHEVGFLRATGNDLVHPVRERTVQVDGTVFAPYSDVIEITDDNGDRVIKGSRAEDPERARVSPRHHGKKGGTATGFPAVAVAAHGGLPWQRVVFAVPMYTDRDEQGAAKRALEWVSSAAGERIQAFNYDRLLDGRALRELAETTGYVGIVEMQEPSEKAAGVAIPADRQRWRGNRVKVRARCQLVAEVTHRIDGRDCPHQLHGLDGALRVTRPAEKATFDSPLCELVSLNRTSLSGGYRMPATYRVPCSAGAFTWTTDFTSPLGRNRTLMHRLRPFPEAHGRYETFAGWRNNVEGTFQTIKRRLPHRRATSWDPDRFQAALIGAALGINAIAWDVHVGRVSEFAKREYARLDRATAA